MEQAKYEVGNHVRHKRTGGVYVILCYGLSVENQEVCYIYQAIGKAPGNPPWIRRASQMEDGRFELVQ